jgi:ABC-type glycerol-3-phosphate transport system substrate-binding protein
MECEAFAPTHTREATVNGSPPRASAHTTWKRCLALLLAACLAALLGGCQPGATPEDATPDPAATAAATAATEPVTAPTPTPTPAGPPDSLTVWISDAAVPVDSTPLTDVVGQQFAAFEATHPGLAIEVQHKKASGPGGIEDLLTTASAVAPAVLPDLVAVDTRFLPGIARKGLTWPLDGLISDEIQADLYPFAQQAGMVDEQWMGVQFEAHGLEHAIYNPNQLAAAPPTWDALYDSGATMIFPAAGRSGLVNDAFLIQYLSTGAQLVDESGQPALSLEALTDVLAYYQQGIDRGTILTETISYATVEQCWPKFLQAEVTMSHISSDLYLSVLTGVPAAVPTRDGSAVMLSRGHAWALTARDAQRQALAVDLLEWLLDPVNVIDWTKAAGALPTRRAAYEQMQRSVYVTFMYAQLETAIPYPKSETLDDIYRAMQQAVQDVLSEGTLPETAAAGVLAAVNQETP